jgi:diguanylate cyclase (GGDEF)-like protein
MRRLVDERAQAYGALIIMRSIEDRRAFEEQLFAAAMTDPLTGLTNRTAFVAMLQHLLEQEVQGCLAIFAIDHFKAINMKHGQAVGDEVLVQFADIMRSRMRSTDIISRIGGESLAVMMPTASSEQTEALCQRLLDGLGDIRHGTGSSAFSITASAGVARIRGTLDDTIKRAEMALFFAKATGRNRLELDGELQPQRKRLTA